MMVKERFVKMKLSQHRSACVYFIGFLDLMAVSMTIPLMLPYITKIGASTTLAGFVSSIYGGVQLFSSPLMGRWSDRIGRRSAILITLACISPSYMLLGCADTIITVALARILLGLSKHSQTMCRTYLCDFCSPEEQTRAISFFNATSSLGFIVGPSLGGHLGELHNGFFIVCSLAGLTFLFSEGLAWLFLVPVIPHPVSKKELAIHVLEQQKTSLSWYHYWDLFAIRFFLSLAPILYRSNFTLVVRNTLGLSVKHLGYIISFQGIVSALSGFGIDLITQFYPNSQKMTIHFSFLQFLSLLSLTFCPTVSLLVLFLIPLSLSNTVTRVSVTKLLIDLTEEEHRGALMGMSQSITSFSRMASPLLAGVLQEWSDYSPGLAAALSSACGVFILLTRTVKSRHIVQGAKVSDS